MTTWQLQDAKNRFSAVVDAALTGEPREISRNVRDFVPAGVRVFNPFEVRRGTVRMKRVRCNRPCFGYYCEEHGGASAIPNSKLKRKA